MNREIIKGIFTIVFVLLLSNCSDLGEERRLLLIEPKTINFGNITVETSRIDSITMISTGDEPVTGLITLALGNNPDFSFVPTGEFSLAPGETNTVFINYTPSADSIDVDTVIIQSNDTKNPYVYIPVYGKGVPVPIPDILLSTTNINFSIVPLNSEQDTTLIISNIGDTTLIIHQIGIRGINSNQFNIISEGNTAYIEANTSASIGISFAPENAGENHAILEILSNDPNSDSVIVSLTGIGGVTYNANVTQIIGPGGYAGCLPTCHGNNGWTYEAIVNVPSLSNGMNYITPGDTSNSYLFLKINGYFPESRMPADNPTYFENQTEELNVIRNWILQGAVEE